MDPLIIQYDSDYTLILELETIDNVDDLKYKLRMTRKHNQRPMIYGNTSTQEYFLSKEQLDSIVNYIVVNK